MGSQPARPDDAPWFPVPVAAWPDIADMMTRSSDPWPLWAIYADLRWWADRERMGRGKRPGRPALCARWHVTSWQAREAMKAEAVWGDPRFRQPAASPPPVDRQEMDAKLRESQEAPPARRQPAASPPPHARSTQDTGHRTQDGDPSTLEGIGTLSSRVLDPLDSQQQEPQDGPQEPQQDRGAPSPAEDPQDAASGQPGAATSMLEGDQGGEIEAAEPEPEPEQAAPPVPKVDKAAELWAELQAIRTAHTPGARGQSLAGKVSKTRTRRDQLVTACKIIAADGFGREDLLRAATWVCTSDNIRAAGARSTGDALAVLLEPSKVLAYCGLAEAEEREAATMPDRREGERRDGDERRGEPRHGAGRDRPPAGSRALADLARRLAEKEAAKAAAEATRAPALRLVETS